MDGWRSDIAIIRDTIASTPSEGWRSDLHAIAETRGHEPQSWREAVRLLASEYGIPAKGWRNDVWGIAQSLGKLFSEGWRKDLRYIREKVEEKPPVPSVGLNFVTKDGYRFVTADGIPFKVKG